MSPTLLRRLRRTVLGVGVLAASLTTNPQRAAANFRTVALSGQPAPGAAGGASFSGFDPAQYGGPALNNDGRTAFNATLAGAGVDATNDRGIWTEGAGALALAAREGEHAPGTPPGAVFSFLNPPTFNDAGRLAFLGYLVRDVGGVTSANDGGVWMHDAGGLQSVARSGDVAPGLPPGTTFTGFSEFITLNGSGELAFHAGATGSGGIWRYGSAGAELLVRSGDHAPGMPADVAFYGINPPMLSDAGDVAFFADLSVAGVPTISASGAWASNAGSLALLMSRDGQAPGLPSGALVNGFSMGPLMNNQGRVMVSATLQPGSGGVTAATAGGLWSDRSGTLELLLQAGSQPPGTAAGNQFASFDQVEFNDAGEFAFHGQLRGGFGDVGFNSQNDRGIWSDAGGGLQLVARSHSPAPGTPAGAVFFAFIDAPALNAAGQVAFEALLEAGSGGVTDSNDLGIWAVDVNGLLRLVVREGDQIDVDDGPGVELRTVSGLEFLSESGGGRSSGFNDLGQIAFQATFSDGSQGIFVSNAVAAPEPGAAVLAAIVFCCGVAKRWRRI